MAKIYRLLLTRDKVHVPSINERTFKSPGEAEKERVVLNAGLCGVPSQGLEWIVVPEGRDKSLAITTGSIGGLVNELRILGRRGLKPRINRTGLLRKPGR